MKNDLAIESDAKCKTIGVNLKLPAEVAEHLKHQARLRSVEKSDDITSQDLIREAIVSAFPLPASVRFAAARRWMPTFGDNIGAIAGK